MFNHKNIKKKNFIKVFIRIYTMFIVFEENEVSYFKEPNVQAVNSLCISSSESSSLLRISAMVFFRNMATTLYISPI